MTWANLISLLRLPLGAAFLATPRTDLRVGLIIAAAASDYVDGWVARRFAQQSRAGEMLDPITDKIFVLCTLAAFLLEDVLNVWELALLLIRDLYTFAGFVAVRALNLAVHFRARFSGKVVTTLQLLAILTLTAYPQAARAAVILTAAAGVWAIYDYTRYGLQSLRAGAHAG